ncbi:hypothetical protein CANTEDRAFT_113121 [Yamadazyma tenuis ATCC 10573]|uniref:Stress-associated endoplasmic reticulum protein n=1 Tax=Candida tenuis (strain ATCC 10573 / BCRC 21748 / CBS 615 / JCM 9827 / NBRC 10315 / NRRL Y-1498 / VKM Y-70) TaxID=590646 RepID=G3B0G6_CANTC|nr:uncharacterized protein CANTEDRAFT_113121 [Yamadazyma tenuis ATCC 10573]XP_006685222.1 uncharacterized protein CANTEDRAFT_113121 [Yamadazyma tenuis ATCC 10573]EGV65535.1 hypothetical protein CANTEDRAFT_113121 [Yamadazyma tenuis ATCC 10573]EGV65536.1 hypothetical protein CANTEDRAFT_113121 [Yamadazyma tenuis ATCC 10573]
MAVQTPKQRLANKKFSKKNTLKQTGQFKEDADKVEYPLPKAWIALLVFLVCGGALLEVLRLVFDF